MQMCPKCKGFGSMKCPKCDGTHARWFKWTNPDGTKGYIQVAGCEVCYDEGLVACSACRGG